jgi:perosamine synthetase
MTETTPMSVPIARASLTPEEIESVLEPLRSGWLVQGPKVLAFEQAWCAFTGVEHSIAVTSCTTALHLSLAALGFGPGDEAIVPAFTWTATANVVEHLGGRVVFTDIDLTSFNIDPAGIEALITPRTKAILPVHLFGLAADMEAINAIAERHGLWVVEDAACGFGATFHGRHVGTFGHTGCFSFHPRKAITTGEGGMITTNDAQLAERLRCLRDHGAAMSDLQRHMGPRPYLLADHREAGYNQRMTDLQASLGAAQMQRAEAIVSERRQLAARYNIAFAELGWLQTPVAPPNCGHGYQSYPCLFEPELLRQALETGDQPLLKECHERRNAWMEDLQQQGVSTRPATHAVHMLTYYRNRYNLNPEQFAAAQAANDCSISLPLFHGMRSDEQQHVIDVVLRREA